MDEIFSKFDGGSAAAAAIRAGIDGDTVGAITLTVVAGHKHIYFAASGGSGANPLALLDENGFMIFDDGAFAILEN